MSTLPLISAIVPAYNHEQFVGDALRSLIAQTYAHVELIVLDDSSTDATYARVEELGPELKRRFVRVEIGTKPHEGSGRTISRCLELAHGDFAYLLNSDDIAYPDAIERLLHCMAAPDVALSVGDNEYIDAAGQPVALQRGEGSHSKLLAYFTSSRAGFSVDRDFGSYESLIEGNYVPNGWLLRRRCVDDVGGYPLAAILHDWPLLLRLAKKYRLCFEGSTLAQYRIHDSNTIATQKEALLLDFARTLLQERAYCRVHGFEAAWSRHAHHVFKDMTPERIAVIVDTPRAAERWWDDKVSRIEDLARIGKLETDLEAAGRELHLVIAAHQTELDRLSSEHEQATRTRLAEAQAAHQAERDRLQLEYEEVTRTRLAEARAAHQAERDSLNVVVSATASRLSAIESSRSWLWTEPIRRGFGALTGLRSHRWELGLDPVGDDSTSLVGLQLTGWAFHRDSPVTRIEVSVERQAPFVTEFGIERPDVAAAFPDCDVKRPGFRVLITVLEDPVKLSIKLVLGDGRTELVNRALRRTKRGWR